MKNINNLLILLAVILIGAISSCDNEDIDPLFEEESSAALVTEIDSAAFGSSNMEAWSEIETGTLPQTALDYIMDNFPDEDIDHVWADDQGGFVVMLENDTALRFDGDGNFIEAIENARKRRGDGDREERDEVDIVNLRANITEYISSNYPDDSIDEAWRNEAGDFIIELESGLKLLFNAEGNFVKELERRHRKRRDHDDDHDWESIEASDLPSAVLDYISTNYPDAQILRVGINEDDEYGVVLDNGLALLFNVNGRFIDSHDIRDRYRDEWTEIDSTDLPTSVLDYMASNYSDATIVLAGTNDDGEYGVILSTGIVLVFDANGNFLEEKEIGYRHNDDCDDDNDDDNDNENEEDDNDN